MRRQADQSQARRREGRAGVVLDIPSQTEFLSLVRDVSKGVAELAGFDAKTAEKVALAVDECTTNVIEHAYRGARDRRVELWLEYRGTALEIDVLDSGAPVDPAQVPELDLQRYAAERRKGGLGVHLMGRIMDSVSFERSARRNVCRLVKRKGDPGDTRT